MAEVLKRRKQYNAHCAKVVAAGHVAPSPLIPRIVHYEAFPECPPDEELWMHQEQAQLEYEDLCNSLKRNEQAIAKLKAGYPGLLR